MDIKSHITKDKKVLSKLLYEYTVNPNENIKSLIIKCLTLFINDSIIINIYIDSIEVISYMCGIETLFKILNMKEYLKEKKIDKIVEYIKKCNLNLEQIGKLEDIIEDESIIKRFSSISYNNIRRFINILYI